MGALPKRKLSTRRQGKRRSSIRLTRRNFGPCPHCGANKLPHRICASCGQL